MVRSLAKYVVYALGCVLLACGSDDGPDNGDTSGSEPTCQESAETWSGIVAGVLAEHVSCNDDDDCALHDHSLECPNGAALTECPMVVAANDLSAALEALDEQGTEFCTEIPDGCMASGSCLAIEPICNFGQCVPHGVGCGRWQRDWEDAVNEAFADFRTCEEDADCTLSYRNVECDAVGSQFEVCPLPVAVSGVDTALENLAELGVGFCENAPPNCLTLVWKCDSENPACESGLCVAKSASR